MFTAVRALAYASLFVAFVLVLVPARLLAEAGVQAPLAVGPLQIAGAIVLVVGGAIAVWSILTLTLLGRGTPAPFDPPRRLVARGPYRFVRNPMYIGAVLAVLGVALYYRSAAVAGYAFTLALIFHLFIAGHEEPRLTRVFGEDYADYRRRVRRWWPRVTPR